MERMFLVADIGGTHCRLALTDGRVLEDVVIVPTAGPSLEPVLRTYCETHLRGRALRGAVVAAAGPRVTGAGQKDRIRLTNSAWMIDSDTITRVIGVADITVINDFEAMAHGVLVLGPEHFSPIHTDRRGTCPSAPRLVVGPGTGLGSAIALPPQNGCPARILAGEGQHAPARIDPLNPRERAVYQSLCQQAGDAPFISVEQMASGPGLVRVYMALCAIDGQAAPEQDLTPERIIQHYRAGSDLYAHDSVMVMATQLGRFAGRLALSVLAQGGIYITGGVVDALGDDLARTPFLKECEREASFHATGAGIPVFRVTHPYPGLIGCMAQTAR